MKAKMVAVAAALALVFSMAAVIMPANPAMAATHNIDNGDVTALIAAINASNLSGEHDTINLAVNGTYTINTSDSDTDGPNGLPSINSSITINGNGATIERNTAGGTPNFRIFHVAATGNVSMFSMTIQNGNVTDNDNNGGGLYNYDGVVTMTNCTIRDNKAYYGGGLYNDYGVVTMTDCTVSGNTADTDNNGGGIYNYNGDLTMTDCTVSDNKVENGGRGGGIYSDSDTLLTMTNCTVSGNTAGRGGGIYYDSGDVTMTNCTVSGNTANVSGGGIYNNSDMTMTNCTVSENTAEVGGSGGGIYNSYNLTMINCTVSGNTAVTGGGGIYNDEGNVTMTCTIVYGNTLVDINGDYDGGENIVGVPDGNPDPLLGPLGDNGGPTFTHALLAGSPAIDGCTGGNCTVDTDQRGVSRPQCSACDVGAYEVGDCCDVATATGTGEATFCASSGIMGNLTAVSESTLSCPEEGKPNLEFTHGFLSFNVTGFTGDTVTINITLPQAVPVGTQYWKCQNNTWVDVTSLLGDDNGDNLLTLTIIDGGLGDADGIANGVIEDPGAPGQTRISPVGGEVYPVDRLQILMPWLVLAALMAVAMAVVVIMKRRRMA